MKKKYKLIKYIIGTCGIMIGLLLFVLFLFPYLERVSATPTETSVDWMKSISDDIRLDEISIPGTHDSATAYVQLPFFMRCQSLTVAEQLEAGYRYLDIRLNEENGRLYFYHSFAKCTTGIAPWAKPLELKMVLTQIYAFLQEHSTETVLFVVKQEGSGEVELFQNTLQEYISDNPEFWLLTDKVPTIGEARGKIVLFRRYEDKADLNNQSGIALNWNDQGGKELQTNYMSEEVREGATFYIQDRYNYSIENKQTELERSLLSAKELSVSGGIRINFVSTAGPNSLYHPYLTAHKMNAWYLGKTFDGKLGWVIFDHGDAKLAESVYQLNN